MEHTRLELVTPCLQGRCSPNWANAPDNRLFSCIGTPSFKNMYRHYTFFLSNTIRCSRNKQTYSNSFVCILLTRTLIDINTNNKEVQPMDQGWRTRLELARDNPGGFTIRCVYQFHHRHHKLIDCIRCTQWDVTPHLLKNESDAIILSNACILWRILS